ncbi:winged helix DNA-binding domain-containing protein [Anaeromyxobacter sp. PSR-1]|uniref:winged helix DNA-binding domain-containing protein n=1 Tax=Anaeromyxobacter sp. PSR-1 TaxID=1300915 RepID=UPI0005E0C2AF|nr:winged helix DNA-binding domain-containing protein [Anaeromyxobacter sp. PSR-1]GAO05404.1 hypothetical protein PSR1_04318 [Anaeromyxobacter sp. PSR-1]
MPPPPLLTRRALNRATLARQLLLARERAGPVRALERLLCLQAQLARPPFLALWARLDGFAPADLSRAALAREVVRAPFLRGTLHLLSARDLLRLRAAVAPSLEPALRAAAGRKLETLDRPALERAARGWLAEAPRTFDALRARVAERFPGADLHAASLAVRYGVPLVQVPEAAAPWGWPGAASFADAEGWLGRACDPAAAPQALLRRALAAVGPASAADLATFTGLGAVREALEGLGAGLRTFRDEDGRELVDLAEAPRPPEDVASPVRFLGEFDALLLAHADRRRFIDDAHRPLVVTNNGLVRACFLVDGRVAGTWRTERGRRGTALVVEPFAALDGAARLALGAEGEALLRFMEPGARVHDVRFARPNAAGRR